jgi:hypothetical protein
MGAKEKAQDLVNKFTAHSYHNDNVQQCFDHAKQCAKIAVDEILDVITSIYDYDFEKLNPYWQEVKQEIENL